MAGRTRTTASWRRTVAGAATSGALAAGLLIGTGVGTSHADVLDDIYADYDTGAGGGQVSNLIHTAMKLRSLGYVPSKGNLTDLQDAMNRRPNQVPLIDALSNTVAYMKRNQLRASTQGPSLNPPVIMNGPQSGSNVPGFGIDPNPNSAVNIPVGQ